MSWETSNYIMTYGKKKAPYLMFQIPPLVYSEPIPVQHSNRTCSLQSHSQDLLEHETKISTATVGEHDMS